MKTIAKILLGMSLLMVGTSSLEANIVKGQKLFIKKMKEHCGFNGAKMASKHTQDEWEKIYNSGKLNDELKAICGQGTKEKYLPHMFDFFYEYASDSGNVPSC